MGGVRTADADNKISSTENSELLKILFLKPEVGQNIAMHAWPTARNFSVLNFCLPGPLNFISAMGGVVVVVVVVVVIL